MVDITKPIQTIDGKPARVAYTERKGACWPNAVLITEPSGIEVLANYDSNWVAAYGWAELVNVPETVTKRVMLRLYEDGTVGVTSFDYIIGKEAITEIEATFKIGKSKRLPKDK